MIMIQVENLTKNFKVDFWDRSYKALDDVSFSIPEGEVTGFLGANGAGKTTFIKIMMKFIKTSEGNIRYSSSLGLHDRDIFRQIGFLPERPYFYPHLTGREFILFLSALSEVSKRDATDRLRNWSERFDLSHALDRKISTYSKGMMQRLGFISAVIHNPIFIVLDEPLSGLDPVGRKIIKNAIGEIAKEGKTIFFSSHIISDVEEICRNIVFLEKGKLAYTGTIQGILQNEGGTGHPEKQSLEDRLYHFRSGGKDW
jgi:ABC-2 type transport system ATP-binding protein